MNDELFDAINASQDNSPLKRYLDRNIGDVPCVGDAVSALVCAALVHGETAEDVCTHLMYAEHEIKEARRAAQEFAGREAAK